MKRDTEGSLQHVVSFVLRAGVIVSTSVGLLSGIYNLAHHASDRVGFPHFQGTPEADRKIPSILTGSLYLHPRALMMLAILLLLLTPIVRVIVSLLGFIKERDRVYVTVTTVVLLTLLASLIFGGQAE